MGFSLNIAMVAACPFPTSQGSQVLIRELSEALVHRGHSVHVVTYHFGEERDCGELTIHRIPELFQYARFRSGPEIRKPILDILLSLKLDQVVRREKIHIIHTHNYEAPVVAFPVRFLRKIPIVYHSHNTMSDEFYTYFRLKVPQALARGAAHLMDRYIPRHADRVIAINVRVAEFLIEMGTPPEKIEIMPPGIDFGPPFADLDGSLRGKLSLGESPLIIYAGNLDAYQRMDLLLDALKKVFCVHQHVKLVVVTSSNTEFLRKMIELRGMQDRVLFFENPSFEIVKEILSCGTLAVNPRISWSGYPIKLLNYMAAELPVVAFQGAAPPIIHEHNGLLVPSGDVEAFADAVLRLLEHSDFAHRLGREARRTVLRNHDWNRIAAEIEGIYAQLLGIKELTTTRLMGQIIKRERAFTEYQS